MSISPRFVFLLALVVPSTCSSGCSEDEAPVPEALGGDADAMVSDTESSDSGTSDTASDASGDTSATDSEPDDAGPMPSLALIDLPRPIDLTPDGSIAAIEDIGDTVELWFYDTAKKTKTKKTTVGDPLANFTTGISANGRMSALHGSPTVYAGYWDEGSGWHDLPKMFGSGCDINVGAAWDISADGKTMVGLAWDGCAPVAIKSIDGVAKALQRLGVAMTPGAKPTNRATVVSDDGTTAAGFAENDTLDRSPAVWRADGTGFLLDPMEKDWPGEVLSIDAHGKTVAGTWQEGEGFVWTEAKGLLKLGKLKGAMDLLRTFPNAISADGKLVFGGYGDPWMDLPRAFVWTAKDGVRAIDEIATAHGVTIPDGITLANVIAASADGGVLLGTATDAAGKTQTFVLRLAPSAYD
jgi:hypothetical protein